MQEFKSNIVVNHNIKPINPTQCGYENCVSSHSFGPCARSHWLLHFVVSGKGIFTTERGNYRLREGDMFIIRPYEITYYEADAAEPWSYIWIGFTSDIPLPAAVTNADVLHAPYLKGIFENASMTDAFSSVSPIESGYEYYLCGAIWQIYGLLSRSSAPKNLQAENYVRTAISTIEAEYSTSLGVKELADRLHLNRSYFSEIFKQVTGISPSKYLTDYRMRKANELLTTHDCNVTVTALSVGYPDVFSFSRAFKHHFGYSPTQAAWKSEKV